MVSVLLHEQATTYLLIFRNQHLIELKSNGLIGFEHLWHGYLIRCDIGGIVLKIS